MGKIICQLCGYQVGLSSNLRRHTKAMHQEGNQNCCNESFADKAKYREHRRTVHKDGRHECRTCARVFSRKGLLRRHESVHTGLKEFGCPSCPYTTNQKSNLERHFKLHHETGHSSTGRRWRTTRHSILAASSSSFIRSQEVTHAATKNVETNLVKKQNKGIHPDPSISKAATVMKGRHHRRCKNSPSDSEQPDSTTSASASSSTSEQPDSTSTSASASSSTDMNPTMSNLKIESPQQCPSLGTMLGSGSSSTSIISPVLQDGSQLIADVKQEGFNEFTSDHNNNQNIPKYYEEQSQHGNEFLQSATNFAQPCPLNPYFEQYELAHMALTTTTSLSYTIMNPYSYDQNYYQQYVHMQLTTTTTTPPLPYTMSDNQSQNSEDLRIQSHYYSGAPIYFEETVQGKENTK